VSDAATVQCPRCGRRYDRHAQYCQLDGARLVSEGAPDPYLGRTLLDQFRIEEVLGSGGMGTVYRARQPSLDRDVAIKILHAELAANPDAVRRFQREARVATAIDHPNVVRVILLGQLPDGSLYLVMEHVAGRSLGQLLRDEGPLPLSRALHIGAQVADAVGAAHAHGVVHRDVKPENVMVVTRGADPDFVKVLDFGIARLMWDEHTVATQSGVIFGTARYISPEGARGDPTDARSDVYSVGVLLYQLVAGVTPFDGNTAVTLLMQHVNDEVPPIGDRAQCPALLAEVVMRALSKRPRDRYADGAALGEALRQAARGCGILLAPSAHGPARPSMVSSPAAAPVAAASLAAAPSPFGDPTASSAAVAGLRGGPRMGPGGTLLLAFLLGAGAVTAGGLLVGWLLRDEANGPAAVPTAAATQESSLGGNPSAASPGAAADRAAQPAAGAASEAAEHAPSGAGEASTPTPERAEGTPARRRRPPPVTTLYPGRGETWQPPVLAPAVEERTEKAHPDRPAEQESPPQTPPKPKPPAAPEVPVPEVPVPEAPVEGPPPPWTGTLM
jgi:eukaryotic-like serine/threonine-protein kinase